MSPIMATKMNIPSRQECLDILDNNKTPSNVVEHCKVVCEVAENVADKLIAKGVSVNKNLVIAGALLHDVERKKEDHVVEGAKLLKKLGFDEVAKVISKHSLYNIEENQPKTVEERIVFYADKRVIGNKIVGLKERFKKLEEKYKIDLGKEFEFTKKIEKELEQ